MMSALISLLFAVAVCLTLVAIATTLRTYGTETLSLRRQVAACDPVRELRFVKITTMVRQDGPEFWRPGFRPLAVQMQARRAQFRQNRRPELRHASA